MGLKVSKVELKREMANSITHGFGLLFGIVSIPILIALAVTKGNVPGIVASAIYGFTFLMVFCSSTLYHGFMNPTVKTALQKLDHISIYFMIAGSYTPFILIYMLNGKGIAILSILWGLTLVGIVFKIFFTNKFKFLSTGIYLIMGWMMLVAPYDFYTRLPGEVLLMVFIGGVLYSLGAIFYLWDKPKWNHTIWHIFVLLAGLCHYTAVLLAVV